ncbi:MAG: cytochrome c [Acidimicrobiia bacterium]
MWRRFVLLGVVVVLAACSAAPAENATGADIYAQLCASCHARDLSGGVGPGLGPGSGAVELSDDVIAQTIGRGKGSRMPAFSRTLSDAQIERVVAFIREQQSG